jgi:hypothetical protein
MKLWVRMLRICVCMHSHSIDNHLIWILEAGPLISEVFLSHLSSFPEGTPNVHLSRFNFILNFLRLSKVSAKSEMSPSSSSQVVTTTL